MQKSITVDFIYLLDHSPYIEELEEWYQDELFSGNKIKARKIRNIILNSNKKFEAWSGYKT